VETDYIFQTFDLTKYGIDKQIERQKPWGTGHAVLEAAGKVNEPFCVINADDFYGYDAFKKMADFLTNEVSDEKYALMGYEKYTLAYLKEKVRLTRFSCLRRMPGLL